MNPQLVLTIIGAVSTLMGVGLYINDGSITSAAFIPFNKWLASKLTPLGKRLFTKWFNFFISIFEDAD